MRRRLVLLAVVGAFAGATATATFASPPDNQGTERACQALEASNHSQGQGNGNNQQSGPPEDNTGTSTAEGILGCNDNDGN